MYAAPRRPYTLIHQPAPGGLELRLFRSSREHPRVVFQIARPDEPNPTDGRIIAIDQAELDLIFHAAHATAHLPTPGGGREDQLLAIQIITKILGDNRAAAMVSAQLLAAFADAGLVVAADPNPPADEARAVLAAELAHRTGADRG